MPVSRPPGSSYQGLWRVEGDSEMCNFIRSSVRTVKSSLLQNKWSLSHPDFVVLWVKLWSACCVPEASALFSLTLPSALPRVYQKTHFTDAEVEAQRGKETHATTHSRNVAELSLSPRLVQHQPLVLSPAACCSCPCPCPCPSFGDLAAYAGPKS